MGTQNDIQEIDWADTFQVGIRKIRNYVNGIRCAEFENCSCHRYGKLGHDERENVTDTNFRRRQVHSRIPSTSVESKGESLA